MRLYIDELGPNHVVLNTFMFPIDPDKISVGKEKLFQEYDVLEIGKVVKPYGNDLDQVEFKVMLLGPTRQALTDNYRTPNEIDQSITTWKEAGTKLRILLTETNLYMDVFIQSYKLAYLNSFQDAEIELSFIRAKDLIVTSAKVTPKTYKPKPRPRPVQNKPSTYKTKPNDTPWSVSKTVYNDPLNADKIVEKNKEVKRPGGVYGPGSILMVAD